jgi:hypothetical protein
MQENLTGYSESTGILSMRLLGDPSAGIMHRQKATGGDPFRLSYSGFEAGGWPRLRTRGR